MRFPTRLLPALLLAATLSSPLAADTLGGTVDFQPARGWHATPTDRRSTFPTLRYEPSGERNSAILLSLLPWNDFNISDTATIRKIHLVMCRPYVGQSKTSPRQTEFKLNDGFGVYSVFEDPDLVGKTPKTGDYKVAIPIAVSIGGKALVQATILCDDAAGASQAEAWRFIRSFSLSATTPDAPKETATESPLAPPIFQAPPGFSPIDAEASSRPSHFTYAGPDGVFLSGWLDRSAKFPGMRNFWAKEKSSLEEGLGVKIENEKMEISSGWNVVTYAVTIDGITQQNLRACRLYNDTWVDVHLSQTGPESSISALKALLPKIGIVAKN